MGERANLEKVGHRLAMRRHAEEVSGQRDFGHCPWPDDPRGSALPAP